MILQVVYLALGFFSLDAQAQWLSIYLIVAQSYMMRCLLFFDAEQYL